MRLEGIDAPEVKGRCAIETQLASKATSRLSQILSGARIDVRPSGLDRYGRTLATLRTGSGDVGVIGYRRWSRSPVAGAQGRMVRIMMLLLSLVAAAALPGLDVDSLPL